MSTNIHPRLFDAPTAPCDSAGHRKGSSQNTSVVGASNKSCAVEQSSPSTDWCYRLNSPARAQANVQAHAETGERRKLISRGRKPRTQERHKAGHLGPVLCLKLHTGTRCMQGARPPQRGGQNGDTPNPVSDYRTASRQPTESGLSFVGRCRAVVTKRVYVSSYTHAGARIW